jgi:hypothetical protein
VVKKVQQQLFNLGRLKKCGLALITLTNFYRCTIEGILSSCITAWYGNCTVCNRRGFQRVMWSAQCITRGPLRALQDIYSTRCHRKAKKIIKNLSYQATAFSPRYHPEGEDRTGASKQDRD